MQRREMAKIEKAAMMVTASDIRCSTDRHLEKVLIMLRAAKAQAERGGGTGAQTVMVLSRALGIYQAESDRRVIGQRRH